MLYFGYQLARHLSTEHPLRGGQYIITQLFYMLFTRMRQDEWSWDFLQGQGRKQ